MNSLDLVGQQPPSNEPVQTPPQADKKSDVVVRVGDLGKVYRIYHRPQDRLKQMLFARFGKSYGHQFWALRNVSFEVKQGQALGIIGRNGSGKSTLLQMIAGTLVPSEGFVEVNGRVAALLELGSGFNPEFTGRENVFLNGSILGLSRKQMQDHFDDIAAFADIGEFLDQPVKTYSSGMAIRLAFSVQQALEPDVLIVDEALSVGDVFFQQKCFKRIHQILSQGTTLLFVSHDLPAVQNLCTRVILLEQGRVNKIGAPEECVSLYYAGVGSKVGVGCFPMPGDQSTGHQINPGLKEEMLAHNILQGARCRIGKQHLEVVAATFHGELGVYALSVKMMETATIRLLLRAREPVTTPAAGIHLYDRMANLVFAGGTRQLREALPPMWPGDECLVTFRLTFSVQPGEYTFSIGCGEASSEGPNIGFVHDRHEGLGPVCVHYPEHEVWPFYGMAQLPMTVKVDQTS
jgi:ABC-type polysaccharide/polyol phosphate transport system ATPase subunit